MDHSETETTVCIDMDKIMHEIRLKDWVSPSPATVEKFKRAVLSKIDEHTTVVEMVGKMPEAVGMVLAAALAQRVERFEYGGYGHIRYTIFDYGDECPEMKV